MIKFRENVPLAPLTTLGVGGNARIFAVVETERMISEAVEFAENEGLPVFILGGGSNVLISDQGFDGLVLQIALKGIKRSDFRFPGSQLRIDGNLESQTDNSELITAQAGENWDDFVDYCVKNNLAGVECLSGIPGFVGGTPVQNVGAYGQEVSETIVSVRCFDRHTAEFLTLTNSDCGFTYRTSIFNSVMRDRYVVLNVTFALKPGGEPKVVYKDLIEHFADTRPSLGAVRDAVLTIRRSKSMVIEPDDPNAKSAGSFFKNPVIEKEKFNQIRSDLENVPHFDFGDKVKIPAAWLIEQSGFHKGFSLGNAGISTRHTLALVNRGGSSAEEILSLKNEIQAAVDAKFGILLQPEPVFIGFEMANFGSLLV